MKKKMNLNSLLLMLGLAMSFVISSKAQNSGLIGKLSEIKSASEAHLLLCDKNKTLSLDKLEAYFNVQTAANKLIDQLKSDLLTREGCLGGKTIKHFEKLDKLARETAEGPGVKITAPESDEQLKLYVNLYNKLQEEFEKFIDFPVEEIKRSESSPAIAPLDILNIGIDAYKYKVESNLKKSGAIIEMLDSMRLGTPTEKEKE
jgi:hypothetical protein